MRTLFVAGHSDSGSRFLDDGSLPWPEQLRVSLEELTGDSWDLVTRRFAPVGPRAVDYLLSAVDGARPDLVILPLTAFVCTVGTVAASVRVRFGDRAGRLYERLEGNFEQRTAGGTVRRRVNRGARAAARRVLGTRTLATVEETADVFIGVLHGLARIENLNVVALADARFSSDMQSREPLLNGRIDRLQALVRPVVEQHRFAWTDVETRMREAPDRSVFYTDDGVHTTAAFHRLQAEVLQEALERHLGTWGLGHASAPG